MAWALQFDGVNDYVSFNPLSSTNVNSDISWDIELDAINDNGVDLFIGITSSTDELLAVRANGNVDYRRLGTTYTFTSAIADTSQRYKIKLTSRWSGGDKILSLYVDDVFISSKSVAAASVAPLSVFVRTSSIYRSGKVINFTYIDNNDPSNSMGLDATASNHTTGQPALTDTIGGNNAQGYNFPTDGSAWVDLSGGDTSIDVTTQSKTITYTVGQHTVEITGEVNAQPDTKTINYAIGQHTVTRPVKPGSMYAAMRCS